MNNNNNKRKVLIIILIVSLVSTMMYLRGCMIYWHSAPFLWADPRLMSKKTIAVCSREYPNQQNFEKALEKKGFRIVPYSDVQSIEPAEFDKRGKHSGLELDWLPPEVIEKVKNDLGVDAILYEWSMPFKGLGMWVGHCTMSLIDIETGESLVSSRLDAGGAFSEKGALAKIVNKTVNMMMKSAKSGKSWHYGRIPRWQ